MSKDLFANRENLMFDWINSLLICLTVSCSSLSSTDLPLDKIILQPGYQIEVFADNLPGARTLTRSPSGVIFVGTRSQGKVYALIPGKTSRDKVQVITLLSNLNEPHGIVYPSRAENLAVQGEDG
jgi:hypothetical protein